MWALYREDIMRAQTQWRTFLRESPAYPAEGFAGRGIVILAGGLTYMVPAWVNIHMLRRTGAPLTSDCTYCADTTLQQTEAAPTGVQVACLKFNFETDEPFSCC